MTVKLKVCGITSLADAHAAIDCGAEFLGFNFYAKSARFIAPDAARRIIGQLPAHITPVGIFVNEPTPRDVVEMLTISGARLAQLHGDEDVNYCAAVGADRVIKALRVGGDFVVERVGDYPAWAVLLDAFDKNLYGGTGKTADWAKAAEVAKTTRVFLAGGLAPENIAAAVRAVAPYGVDVNSGVESAPGKKDAARLAQLQQELERLS